MAENDKNQGFTPEYPNPGFPVVFADNVSNAVWGNGVVKFYFTRHEPAMLMIAQPTKETAFAQVIVPFDGFARIATFFEAIVNKLIKEGNLTQERVDELRKSWEAANASGSAS